jgi:surfactin synthase thioesterase subunit
MKPQIFFLHFAGGNKYSFKFILPFLNQFNVHCLELPGRGMRMSEKLVTEFDCAVNDYFGQIIKLAHTNFAIFGHSMGAILMLRLVKRLEKAGKFPFCVFISGNPGPSAITKKDRHLFNKPEFKEELIKYGGMPKEVLDDEELYDFFEPILRADFEVVARGYDMDQPVISSPILAMMGNEEHGVEKIDTWRAYTKSSFESRCFQGGHFFIYDHPKAISLLVEDSYNKRIGFLE